MERLRQFAEASAASGDLARAEPAAGPVPLQGGGTARIGVVSAGAAYLSAREALPGAAFLKLGMIHPLPVEAIRAFAQTVDRLFVVEELEPYLEEQILAAGIACEGKQWFPQWGELTAVRVGRGFYAAGLDLPRWAEEKAAEDDSVIPRPPVLCTGCPHRGMATAMKKLNLDVHGDIGCYDLTTLPPVSHMHSAVEMGASIPMEQGFMRAGGSETGSLAVIGDSTFLHSGLTGLLNAVHQRTNVTVLIQDNSITAMTGGQTNPGNERTLAGAETKPVDIAGICKALGVEQIEVVDPYDYEACLAALKAGLAFDGPAVIITNRPCMLFPSKIGGEAFTVDEDVCNACQQCMKLGCPSLSHTEAEHKGRHKVTDRRGDLHRLLAVPAALQAGGHLEGEGRCGMSAIEHYHGGVVDDIMVVGVGGQGVIVAAAVIADTAMLHGGLDVKLSETRGMSQRGGSVSSHIRIGETVVAPSISPGEVDYLLAFEKAEGLRAAPSVVPGGVAIVNTQEIVPPLASQGDMSYPFDAAERMAEGDRRVIVVDGNGIALQVGDLKVAGIVLVGAL